MSLDNMAMTIYGDSISGNCLKVKFVAERLGIAFRWIETSVLEKHTRTPEFLAINPAGQVPVVTWPDGRVLAQSNAIMLFLADGSELIPRNTFERASMYQWLFWEQYSHETAIAVLRFKKHYLKLPDSEIDPALPGRCQSVLAMMENHLGTRRFFVADKLSLADIALVAYTRFAHEAGLQLPPTVASWVRRVEHDLKLDHLI